MEVMLEVALEVMLEVALEVMLESDRAKLTHSHIEWEFCEVHRAVDGRIVVYNPFEQTLP